MTGYSGGGSNTCERFHMLVRSHGAAADPLLTLRGRGRGETGAVRREPGVVD